MKRKTFITLVSSAGSGILLSTCSDRSKSGTKYKPGNEIKSGSLSAELVITGGGLGGCAAAIAECRTGLNVIMTEAPRPDGGQGWPGLRLRGDVMGTGDGMAKYPYIRESRRIKAVFTVLEEHVGAENRKLVGGDEAGKRSAPFSDSVGIGYYHIDLHPSSRGNNYIDFPSLPFQIPLGALLPQRMNNLIAANKNIGTTHITNGCYRLHPVEWSIREAAGCLVAFCKIKNVPARAVRERRELLEEFQNLIRSQGIETNWPDS